MCSCVRSSEVLVRPSDLCPGTVAAAVVELKIQIYLS